MVVQARKNDLKTAHVSPNFREKEELLQNNRGQVFGLKGDEFYAASDKIDDKKLVNISIDELNDEMPSDAEVQYPNQNS